MTSQTRATVVSSLLLLMASIIGFRAMASTDSSSSSQLACQPISGPFHMRGAQILNDQNERYIPYGIGIVGLAHALYAGTVQRDEDQITAAKDSWCANTVRLQVSEYQLIDGTGFDPANLGVNTEFFDAVKAEVDYARNLGLMVVLNLQTQSDPDFDTTLNLPTNRTLFFWRTMASQFGQDQGVVFDLFNEPGQVSTWARWRNGFTENGVRYLGFQQLATRVRNAGARNILWVEGISRAGSLAHAWEYHLTKVGPIMYSEHRPPRPNRLATWRSTFGYLAERDLAPVVVGEWAQYARTAAPWACWRNAPTQVPEWLSYLRSIGVGLIANKLTQGQLIQSTDYSDPTVFKSDWACQTGLNQGAGQMIMDWFHAQNVPTPGRFSRIARVARTPHHTHGWTVTATVMRDGKPWPRKTVRLEQKTRGQWRLAAKDVTGRRGGLRIDYTRKGSADPPMRLHFSAQDMYPDTSSRLFRLPRR